MSWLADASANKIVKSYIKDFVDVSGNFKVRNTVSGTVVDNGPVAWNQLGADINGEAADDRSGWRLALSSDGTIVAIGATNNDGNGAESGHVRIYGYSGSSWTQLGSDINGEAAGDQLGFDVSLSSDGTILATGAWTNDGNGANSGHVRIYEYNGSSWTQLGADIDGEGAGDVFGGSVTLSSDGTIVAIGGTRNDGGGTDSGHVRIYGYNGSSWSQLGADIDGSGAGESFGKAISLSSDGTIAAIGAQGVDGLKSGLVRVYEYNGSSWSQLGVDIHGEGEGDRFGGPLSLSSDGTILATGGVQNDENGSNSGHVRIYKYSGGSWTQLGSDIDGEAAGDYLGFSVSLSSDGTIVAIGAIYNDGNGADSGHARIYEYDGSSWTQIGSDIIGEAAGDLFGWSISLSSDGTIVAIGANKNDGGGTDSGHVRVYNKTGGVVTTPGSETIPLDVSGGIVTFFQGDTVSLVDTGPVAWSQLGADIDGEAAGDNFGTSISLSSDGTRVVIGGSTNDGTGADAGHARVYEYNGSAWSQLGADLDSEAADDRFGTSVSISSDGTRVAVGGVLNDGGGANSGYARVYEYDGSSWNQLGADIDGEASSDYTGKSISLSSDGTIVAVGGHLNDGNGSNAGHVRIFAYIGSSWTQMGADLNGPTSDAYFGATVSLSSDGTIVAIGAFNTTGSSSYSGKTSIYKYNGSSWSQLGADISGEAANDKSGYDVALSSDGTIVAIGARFNDGGGSNSGHTRIYEYNGSSWSQVGGDIDGEASNDESGFSVSLSGDGTIVAVGAHYNDGNGDNSGHVRIYEYDGSNWNQVGADIDGEAAGDSGGHDVSLSSDGTRVAIGGKYSDGSGADAGHARIYNKTGGVVTTYTSIETMKIEDGTVDISGTTWINQGQSGASIASSNQGAFIVESAGTSSSNAVVYVETAGQTEAFSIRENGDLYSANALQHSSDDRRKTNEQYITNATETIKKLSPQIYTKLNDLVQNGGTPSKTESGLIAQEIYYNAPELRHLVHIEDSAGNKLTPQEYDLSGNDIQNDPDYTALGWGNKSATVDYTGLIPYLIKANQEKQTILEQQDATIDEQKTMVDDLLARISALE